MMSFIKILLIAFGLILLGMLAFPIIGFIYNALWYLFWIAVVGIGGYVGYKWLTKNSDTPLLEDRTPHSIAGMESVNKAFEDFKRKHLTK
jgi:hypothetical protein